MVYLCFDHMRDHWVVFKRASSVHVFRRDESSRETPWPKGIIASLWYSRYVDSHGERSPSTTVVACRQNISASGLLAILSVHASFHAAPELVT